MKKLIALILVAILLLAMMPACGKITEIAGAAFTQKKQNVTFVQANNDVTCTITGEAYAIYADVVKTHPNEYAALLLSFDQADDDSLYKIRLYCNENGEVIADCESHLPDAAGKNATYSYDTADNSIVVSTHNLDIDLMRFQTLRVSIIVDYDYKYTKDYQVTDILLSDGEFESVQSNKTLRIDLNGSNEAVITLTDDSVGKLSAQSTGDGNYQLNNSINIRFISNDQLLYRLDADALNWQMYPEGNFETEQPAWWVQGDDFPQQIEGNTVSWTVQKAGICDMLKDCDTYEVDLISFTDGYEHALLAQGNLADCIHETGQSSKTQIVFRGDDVVILRIADKQAEQFLQGAAGVTIDFYQEQDENSPGLQITGRVNDTEGKSGEAFAGLYEYTIIDEHHRESRLNLFTALGDYEGDNNIGNTVYTDNEFSIKICHKNIRQLIEGYECYKASSYEQIYEKGYCADVASEETIPVVSMPDFVPENAGDKDYFAPVSDNYKITVVEMPNVKQYITHWYQRMGYWVYGPEENKTISAQFVVLDSYDEFGLISSQVKIIYPNAEEAKMASVSGSSMIVAENLTGKNKRDDSLVTQAFFDENDQLVFGQDMSSSETKTYHGVFDNVRYFTFVPNRTWVYSGLYIAPITDLTDCPPISLEELSYTTGKVLSQNVSLQTGETLQITTYSSK